MSKITAFVSLIVTAYGDIRGSVRNLRVVLLN